MEIAEYDGHRQVHNVAGVPLEEPHKLHHFGEGEHEDELCP
jgi:hypothetical protein